MAENWLNDFVEFAGYGESSPKILYWVGVSTIAGALRRKVWIDQTYFQWSPNFYLLIVGPPGQIKKSTSINLGFNLLKQVDDIDFGPESISWQQLISHMASAKQTYTVNGKPFEASCCTIGIDEFGTFFEPTDRSMVDNLTNLWDSKRGVFRKETKTMGSDEVVNPWLNIAACTTPGWLADNFTVKLLRSGFASRPIFLYEEKPLKDVPYPSRAMPDCVAMQAMEENLVERLREIANLSGEFMLTEAAYRWGEKWYGEFKKQQRCLNEKEAAFYERKQTHLHKLAMVICAATGSFPTITVEHLIEADNRLRELEADVSKIFGFVGQTRLSSAASEVLEIMHKVKSIRRKDLYYKYFFKTMDEREFDTVLRSAQATGKIVLAGPLTDLLVRLNTNEVAQRDDDAGNVFPGEHESKDEPCGTEFGEGY